MTFALGPGIVLYVIPEGLYDIIRSLLNQKPNNDETDNNGEKANKEDSDESLIPKLNDQSLQELSLNYSQINSFELNPFEDNLNNDSSLQLLSDSQLDSTLDKELGLEVQLSNEEDIKIVSSNSSNSGKSDSSHSNSGGIHFVSTHFSRNSSSESFEEDYELISETEIQDSTKGSTHDR